MSVENGNFKVKEFGVRLETVAQIFPAELRFIFRKGEEESVSDYVSKEEALSILEDRKQYLQTVGNVKGLYLKEKPYWRD